MGIPRMHPGIAARGHAPFLATLVLLLLCGGIFAARSHRGADALGPQAKSNALPTGGRWVPTSLHANTTAMLIAPEQPLFMLAATTDGIWRSTDGGATWSPDGTGLRGNPVFVLAGSPAGTARWAGSFDGTVYARAAGKSVTWRRISSVLRTDPAIGVVPIYSLAASTSTGVVLLAGSQGAVFRGEPGATGRSWHWTQTWRWPGASGTVSSGAGAVTSLQVAKWDPRLVFASVFGATPPVMVSRDGGRTWASGAAGLPAILPVQDLASGSPPNREVYLTTMGGGVWRRGADGRWVDVSAGMPQRHAMALLAAGSGTLYAGTMSLGVYEKQGAGPWRPLGSGLRGPAATVMDLVETPGAHPVLLAATTQGVYRYIPD
ncbi:MAG: hypothetical protein JWO42_2901 [Chloroflexi bacterium]|nr:hypothetical protein [Chloroflexota bacterium]